MVLALAIPAPARAAEPEPFSVPMVDLSADARRQTIVDREAGVYLGHPTTVLLEDGRTILCVYPKGHGRGAIVLKKSVDGGRTWSDRLPTPKNWETSLETPSIHRVMGADGSRRLIVWSGLHPARLAVSEDDGSTWSELKPAGDWGGIVVMGFVEAVRDQPGEYIAQFHDDGRYFRAGGKLAKPVLFTLYQTRSTDGGLTWSSPETLYESSDVHLCEPGVVRAPDGKELTVLLRENSRRKHSHWITSHDEGRTWSKPAELSRELTGDRHTAKYAPDGRLVVSFRDTAPNSPTVGDWVVWIGRYGDLQSGGKGQYRVRLMDNLHKWDCAYPGVECLPDGTFVVTTYGHWTANEKPYLVSVRFTLAEIDALATQQKLAVPGASR